MDRLNREQYDYLRSLMPVHRRDQFDAAMRDFVAAVIEVLPKVDEFIVKLGAYTADEAERFANDPS